MTTQKRGIVHHIKKHRAKYAVAITAAVVGTSSVAYNKVQQPVQPAAIVQSVSHAQCNARQNGLLPDPNCTPGATNADISQANINQTICAHGKWSTKSIRPPASYTTALKKQQIVQYGYKDTNPADYEEDHLISLELGGNPTDPQNLWPESRVGSPNSADKDKVENFLNAEVCNGDMTLDQAQQGIASDWTVFIDQAEGVQ